MQIRPAQTEDLDALLPIFASARRRMRAEGNDSQWVGGYPSRELLESDLAAGNLYLFIDEKNTPHGAFVLVPGDDPTYAYIEGAWLSDTPYQTIHRIATDGTFHGALAQAVAFAAQENPHIRIDTHQKNVTMQAAIAKCGFEPCGIIYIGDGSPRVAFELV